MRWMIFSFLIMIYLMLLLLAYRSHVLLGRSFSPQELLGYILCTIMLIPILPSVILEVDYVKIGLEEIVFQNLLMRKIERWENLVKFDNPRFLKFAIVRTKSFMYLLNKRDIQHFDELIETIKQKAINLKK